MDKYVTTVNNVTHYDSAGNYIGKFEKGTILTIKKIVDLPIAAIAQLEDDTLIISRTYKEGSVIEKIKKKGNKKDA